MKNTNRLTVFAGLFVLWTLLGGTGQVQAATFFAPETPTSAKVNAEEHRANFSVRISAMSGLPDVFGVNLSLKAFHPFEVELGASFLLLGFGAHAKAGLSLPWIDARDELGRGWALRFLALGGYRYIVGGLLTSSEVHAITANVALDSTYWFSKGFGIEVQLSLGGGLAMQVGSEDISAIPDVRLSIGLAF